MRFDEAFDILVDHCVEVSPSLAGNPNAGRTSTYDNDISIAGIARSYWARRIDPNMLAAEHYLPFYDAGGNCVESACFGPASTPRGAKEQSAAAYTAATVFDH